MAALVDLVHALAMAAWVLGMPLLFLPGHTKLRRAYAMYAVGFVVLSQLSRLFLGECFLTSLARPFYARAGSGPSPEWFTVRAARAVFGLAPSTRLISTMGEVLVVVTAIGVLALLRSRSLASPGPGGPATQPR